MKRKPTYNWNQIKQVIKDIYKVEASPDSWNVPVIYEESMLKFMQRRLRNIKKYVK